METCAARFVRSCWDEDLLTDVTRPSPPAQGEPRVAGSHRSLRRARALWIQRPRVHDMDA